MTQIGKPIRIIEVDPIELPEPLRKFTQMPVIEPEPELEPQKKLNPKTPEKVPVAI